MDEKIYRNADGKIVAKLNEKTLFKKVKRSKHMFRQMQGWGFDESIITQATKDGANRVEVLDIESNILYSTSIANFIFHSKTIDYGHGKQYVLAGNYWQTRNEQQERLL